MNECRYADCTKSISVSAKESALFHIFHHDQRTLLNGFTVKLEINGPDNLTFFQRCGKLRFR